MRLLPSPKETGFELAEHGVIGLAKPRRRTAFRHLVDVDAVDDVLPYLVQLLVMVLQLRDRQVSKP